MLHYTDSSQVDFTNPENFFHDVNSVAGLLKQFFRELPDPLFTNKFYADFINAARTLRRILSEIYKHTICNYLLKHARWEIIGRDDDIQRRDALHALINNLPDPNYATLRALVLVRSFLIFLCFKLIKPMFSSKSADYF